MQSLGQLIGMLLLNLISDRIGRKVTLYVLWVLLNGSLLIETFARDWRDRTGAKIVAGAGVGAIQSTLYMTEWSPANIRGAMVLVYGVLEFVWQVLASAGASCCPRLGPAKLQGDYSDPMGFLGNHTAHLPLASGNTR